MTQATGENLDEEPQDERGAAGTRDTGPDGLSGGSTDRPAGVSDARTSTSVDPQDADEGAPHLQTP